ncbi:class I SAM-dependent methyltransferase [Prosthecomicrobium pneumaticum]|uniref:Ubiquinone/menaquinone biosynthesis C-methylase UbiE n=1 Tax=Prosthecomicrobium pneumaticum TaxID=81895 RepID=A0A7W9FM54_9HYPH|nr:class I SAM-dependent methyltransferase [Prosthecomicrobium pneumaticum]MBB5753222.1 ubiquinone/menaquinone biosynthesis C-methylase UbiE [Prosthecomicrobium pneumaticum]
MSAVMERPAAAAAARPSYDPARVAFIEEAVRTNRFLPTPEADRVFVGDGGFREIGAEFLGHLVRLGGLLPSDRVLDLGCGIGRIALPLTQYLDPATGAYEGIDPVVEGIRWTQRRISTVYPNFAFRAIDIAHPLYNPNGKVDGRTLKLPFSDARFDFALMVSVLTHLPTEEALVQIGELGRVVAPGGRIFLTLFAIDAAAREARPGRDPRLGFRRIGAGPAWCADPAAPLGAVGFDDGFIDAAVEKAGFAIVEKGFGRWRGAAADHFQDVIVAERRA